MQRVVEEQAQGEVDWFPAEWISRSSPAEFAKGWGEHVAARVRGLAGEELENILQNARKKLL